MVIDLQTLVAASMLAAVVVGFSIIAWGAFFHMRQRVVFVPTPRVVVDAMIDLAELSPGECVMDLGAGEGCVLRRAMHRCPGIHAIGYEGAFGVWLLGKIRSLCSRTSPTLYFRNFLDADLRQADVVFTYLSVSMMEKLKPKFLREFKPGTRLVSHAFSLKGIEPAKVASVAMPLHGTSKVFLYRF